MVSASDTGRSRKETSPKRERWKRASLAHAHGAAVVLQRRRQNLAGAGAAAVDEDHGRVLLGRQHQRALLVRVVDFILVVAPLGADDAALLQKQVGDLDRGLQQAAR